MTDVATALADSSALPTYGGKTVTRTTISVRNAGVGLSEGLAIAPQVLDIGSTRYVVLECVVHAHDHDRILDRGNDTGLLVLDQVLKAGTGTLIDGEVVREAIRVQADRIQTAKDAAEGKARLPFHADELAEAHADGGHADALVPGCPHCDDELAAKAAEAAADAGTEPRSAPTPLAGRRAKRTGEPTA